MALGRPAQAQAAQKAESNTGRPVQLEGDSPEVVAFALLRYLAQLEQQHADETGVVFDRDWLLDAYSECLEAVRGLRTREEREVAPAPILRGRGPRR
jgi:hypothetical protein